jgi:hypothetical protein
VAIQETITISMAIITVRGLIMETRQDTQPTGMGRMGSRDTITGLNLTAVGVMSVLLVWERYVAAV